MVDVYVDSRTDPGRYGVVGCNRAVKFNRKLADGGEEGFRMWGGGGGVTHKTVDNGGAGTRLSHKNSVRA